MKKIKFIPQTEIAMEIIDPPRSAKNFIPNWYKKNTRKINKDFLWRTPEGMANLTVKACMPVLDSITAGYIITLSADVYATKDHRYGNRLFWDVDRKLISLDNQSQYGELLPPEGYEKNGYKWHTDWIIKTPKKYSVLIIHPNYHFDLPFITLPGIVDTDKYGLALNLPFFLKEDFEGLIPKGTPIAQIIPIKRESWISSLNKFSIKEKYHLENLKSKFERSYQTMMWEKKEYS
jgi:hypothetical protein